MSSLLAAPPATAPRVDLAPPGREFWGAAAADLAADGGLILDDWQRYALDVMLRERADGKWSSFEVALIVPRQNGKGSILEARELVGLFALPHERLIVHTAHEYKTAREAFLRVRSLIGQSETLRSKVAKVRTANGEESIETVDGSRLRFLARSAGSGRGFTGDCIILDEAYAIATDMMAALLPTLSARPNPQVIYASMAGKESSVVLAGVHERAALAGPRLCYLEWGAPEGASLDDRGAWRVANPAMASGRIDEEFVEREREVLSDIDFARERLNVWGAGAPQSVIAAQLWQSLTDVRSQARDPVSFAVDVTPDRSSASIGMAGRRTDGLLHVEVVDNRRGTGWAVPRLAELVKRWGPSAVVLDASGPAGSLLGDLAESGVEVTLASAREMAQACGVFFDAAAEGRLRHLGQPVLSAALGAAKKRPLGDAWAWHRRDATDISPLVAVTLALHSVTANPPAETFIPRRIR